MISQTTPLVMRVRLYSAALVLAVVLASTAAAPSVLAQQPDTPPSPAEPGRAYILGTGDVVRVTVFQQPDMNTETRVAETGTITFPLIGPVAVGGSTAKQAEDKIVQLLKSKGFVKDPQVNVTVLQFNSQLVSVLGHVNRPGRYPLQEGSYRLTDVIAMAGGVSADGADSVILVRQRAGKTITLEVDLPALFKSGGALINPEVVGGDSLYVDRYPYFYIYGEVQRPGVYRLEKGMTLIQALSVGGGFTLRAARKDIQINRRDKAGKIVTAPVQLNDLLVPDDVVYVKESLF